ncbi:MAG: HD domain-containing protein [Acidimicrobiia bacterium]|nr:HD domain-containing protein [Acidimicrobiia bacterium]
MSVSPPRTVEELVEFIAATAGVFDSQGPDGDPIDILEHSLQCAHVLAAGRPADVELQVAGLVHDLGHVADPDDPTAPVRHGEIGAAFVEPLLGARVARLVALHVPAKRYLVATDPTYGNRLSDGSSVSLGLQGGAMTTAEIADFGDDPDGPDAAVLRRADEAAKVIGRVVPGLDTWVGPLRQVAGGSPTGS